MKGMQLHALARAAGTFPETVGHAAPDVVADGAGRQDSTARQGKREPDDLRETVSRLVERSEQYASEARARLDAATEAIEREISLIHRLRALLSPLPAGAPPQKPPGTGGDADPAPTPAQRPADRSRHGTTHGGLSVYCLGEFPVQDWPGGKARAVFKYLLLHRRAPVAREVLMQRFWPDAPADAARNNLNVAIYTLRKCLGQTLPAASALVFADGHYQLNPALDIWVDREDFLLQARTGRQRERDGQTGAAIDAYLHAQTLYGGPLLVEDLYDEWLQEERARLQETALDVQRRLHGLYRQTGDAHGCIDSLRHLLEIDPCDESAHRELMRLYARRGDAQLALRQFKHCADALARTLNMIPSPETVSLLHQIRRRETL